MILLIHIASAITSLAVAGWLYFRPSNAKLQATYGLTGAMLLTGFYLIASEPAHMVQSCITGISFLAAISYGIVAGRNKLVQIATKK